MSAATPPKAPPGLCPRGRRFWRSCTAAYEMDVGETEVLEMVCRCLDRVQGLDDALREGPATVPGSQGQPRPNPLASELRAEVTLCARLIAQLGLPDPDDDGRPLTSSEAGRRAARARWSKRGGAR